MYETVYPLGRSTAKAARVQAPVQDLKGKTICGSGHSFVGDEVVAEIVALLRKEYPDIKFIPNSELPPEASTPEQMAALGKLLKSKGCDLVLSATGC